MSMRACAGWATALLVVGQLGRSVQAQRECSFSTGFVIASPDDVDELSGCSSVNGSISLRFADNYGEWTNPTVDLGDIRTIIGDLVIYPDYRHDRTSIVAERLEAVEGAITIQNPDFSNVVEDVRVSFPALKTVQDNFAVTGEIGSFVIEQSNAVHNEGLFRVWGINVDELSFGGLERVDGDFSVDTNAQLTDLDLRDLTETGSGLRIVSNDRLASVNFESLRRVERDLQISQNALTELEFPALEFADIIAVSSNGRDAVFSFPKLASVGARNTSATSSFNDVKEVDLPILERVNGGLSFQSTSITQLVVPALRTLNGSITVENNAGLISVALPRLEEGGDIFIEDNSNLSNITANELVTARTILISGDALGNLEFFSLREVSGDFKITGMDTMDCTWFDEHIRPAVRGTFSCVGSYTALTEERQPSTNGGPHAGTQSLPDDEETDETAQGGSSSGLSVGAQAGIGVGVATVAILIALAAFVYIRRRRSTKPTSPAASASTEEETKPVADDSSSSDVFDGRKEMGVHTTIRAVPQEPPAENAPRLSLLSFGLSAGLGRKDDEREGSS